MNCTDGFVKFFFPTVGLLALSAATILKWTGPYTPLFKWILCVISFWAAVLTAQAFGLS